MERGPEPSEEPAGPPRFLLDAMLGRLATWLRLLGYDAVYSQAEDAVLLRQSREEGRILLTRDTRLLRRRELPPHLGIESDHVAEQLRQVVQALRLDVRVPRARRCARCNAPLSPQSKAEVAGRVPDFIFSHHADFWGCPTCGRIYWAGSHRQHMDARIHTLAP